MMNRYIVKAVDAVVATNGNDPITGRDSDRWKNAKIENNSGATDKVAKDTNLIYQKEINANATSTALSKIVSFNIGEIPDSNEPTVIQIPLNVMEFSYGIEIFGMHVIGVENQGEDIAQSVLDKNNSQIGYMILDNKMILNIDPEFGVQSNSTIHFIVYYR